MTTQASVEEARHHFTFPFAISVVRCPHCGRMVKWSRGTVVCGDYSFAWNPPVSRRGRQ